MFGVLLHDRGPFSDRHESGVDPNWELQFQPSGWPPWRWIGAPNPIRGVTPNFVGDTSVFYGGLSDELSLSQRWLNRVAQDWSKPLVVSGSLSYRASRWTFAQRQNLLSGKEQCRFWVSAIAATGCRIWRLLQRTARAVHFYDHMSHKHVLPGEKEGIDHIGLRYHFTFHAP